MMREVIMKKNYSKAFRMVILLAVVLAVISAVAIPLSLSRQVSDISALEQTKQEQMMVREGDHGEGRGEHDEAWKSQITPLSAVNYAVIGGAVAGAGPPLLLAAGRRLAL